ncbi:MAG: glycosyltransferase family 4 protein [Lachnospiraceae bacterium]|nr:glycosyltransferase family 4 protein [Lachnospiraceae bacterium]
MKILIVRTFPNIINPDQYNMQEIGLAKALIRAGHTCGIVLYYGKNKDTIEKIPVLYGDEQSEITVYRLRGFNILKNGFFPSLHKIVKEYDIIQVHEYDQITSWFYYAWSKQPVVIYHGPYYHSFNKGYNLKCKIFDHTFLKIRQNKNAVCLAKSHAAADFLKRKGFFYVTAAGVGLDTENFKTIKEKEETPISVPEGLFNLLYVGKIEERRNPYFLLGIMEKMLKSHEDINCIIIGNGETRYTKEFLQKAEPLIQTGRLQYYPCASQNQLADIYRAAQLMIFPTNYDIFGMVLLEALYFELPVISSENGGADMLIRNGENGYIIPEMDQDVWLERIEQLYQNKEEYLTVKNNIRKADKETLSWDAVAKTFIEAYENAKRKQKV